MSTETDDYVEYSDVLKYLEQNEMDDKTKAKLNLFIEDANIQLTLLLKPYSGELPFTGDFYTAVKMAGITYVISEFWDSQQGFEGAKRIEEKFKSRIKTIIDALKATPTNRTRLVASSPDYDTEDSLFSQTLR